jgi:hypothetical protein
MLYSVFGLSVTSDLPVPGLELRGGSVGVDVHLWFRQWPSWLHDLQASKTPFYARPDSDGTGVPSLRVETLGDGGYLRFCYCDGTQFLLDRGGTNVWARWPEPLTVEDTATYLLGPILGFLLRLRGITCLHASAVATGGRAFALAGPPRAGKSTTAAAFARRGLPVLSDDVVALDETGGCLRAQPGNPRIRLWPESVWALYGAPDALPLLTPNWNKRYLDLGENGSPFQEVPLPLAAIYLLGERSPDKRAPFVEALPAPAALMALVAETYTNYLLDREMRAREFEVLGRLVNRIPVRKVTPHADPAALGKLCDVLLEDFQAKSTWSRMPGQTAVSAIGAWGGKVN